MPTTKEPTKEEQSTEHLLTIELSKWVVDSLGQYGPKVAVTVVTAALSIFGVSAGMTRQELLDVVTKGYDHQVKSVNAVDHLRAMLERTRSFRTRG